MRITEMKSLGQRRFKITLDDEISFVLYQKERNKLNLEEGDELSLSQYEEIQEEILIPRIKTRTLYLLGQMDRSERQLREKLRQGHYEEGLIDIAVDYAKGHAYLDDMRYAQSFVRSRAATKSKRQLRHELFLKGITQEMIEQALEEEYSQPEEAVIKKWLEKRDYDSETAAEKEKQKMYRYLMGKGFSSSDILRYL